MQPGEIVVANISGGPSVRRCLDVEGPAVRVSLGRNRQARIPRDRILMFTGLNASSEEEVEEFRTRCAALAAEINLEEVWQVVRDETSPVSLDDLAELYWPGKPDQAKRVALLLHLEQPSLYFQGRSGGYLPRSREAVAETIARRSREAANQTAADELVDHLSRGGLPPELSGYQRILLAHLRGFAVFGDDYTRATAARALLGKVTAGRGDLQRLGFEVLARAGVIPPDEPLELERAGIVEDFSADALAEAAAVDPAPASASPYRRDLTHLRAVTIDDAETEDRDDAVSFEETAVGYQVGIHIADAGALIARDGAIDGEADRRMATLYLPERKVDMLPPRISRELGSLVPGETRLALSLLVTMAEPAEIVSWEAFPAAVRSRAALSYEEADAAITEAAHPWHHVLAGLDRVARSLRDKRRAAGAVVLDPREMKIKLSAGGRVDVTVVRRSPARALVAELMVLCNSLLAALCVKSGLPAAYRVQRAPEGLGHLMADGVPQDPLGIYLLMKRLPPAELGTAPGAHAGLGVAAYLQATSPLRRYPDLAIQRQISHFLAIGQPLYTEEAMASIAARAEVQLREHSRIEEERKRYWFLKYLQQTAAGAGDDSNAFAAVVLDNPPGRPALMELADYPFRVRAALPPEEVPGSTVTLRLHGVDLWTRTAQLVHERRAG